MSLGTSDGGFFGGAELLKRDALLSLTGLCKIQENKKKKHLKYNLFKKFKKKRSPPKLHEVMHSYSKYYPQRSITWQVGFMTFVKKYL